MKYLEMKLPKKELYLLLFKRKKSGFFFTQLINPQAHSMSLAVVVLSRNLLYKEASNLDN